MSSPWTPAKELDAYRHRLDYRIEDKLDRLRAAVWALTGLLVGILEQDYNLYIPDDALANLQAVLEPLETAEDRLEYEKESP